MKHAILLLSVIFTHPLMGGVDCFLLFHHMKAFGTDAKDVCQKVDQLKDPWRIVTHNGDLMLSGDRALRKTIKKRYGVTLPADFVAVGMGASKDKRLVAVYGVEGVFPYIVSTALRLKDDFTLMDVGEGNPYRHLIMLRKKKDKYVMSPIVEAVPIEGSEYSLLKHGLIEGAEVLGCRSKVTGCDVKVAVVAITQPQADIIVVGTPYGNTVQAYMWESKGTFRLANGSFSGPLKELAKKLSRGSEIPMKPDVEPKTRATKPHALCEQRKSELMDKPGGSIQMVADLNSDGLFDGVVRNSCGSGGCFDDIVMNCGGGKYVALNQPLSGFVSEIIAGEPWAELVVTTRTGDNKGEKKSSYVFDGKEYVLKEAKPH